MVKLLLAAGHIKSAFVNYIDSELLVVTREGFKPESLNKARELLPIWLEGIQYPKDPSIVYATTCTKICRITTTEVDGSPMRLMLMYPGLEKLL